MFEPCDANQRRVFALRAEIDTATAMMTLVKYTREFHLVRKYEEVAVRSFIAALDLIARSTFLPAEEDEVWDLLAPIRQWLERERLVGGNEATADLVGLAQPSG